MCIFSQPVIDVSDTNIFARLIENGWQHIVYQMNFESAEDNAIILPLPVALPSTEDESLEFISLQDYGGFFSDLRKGFPLAPTKSERNPSRSAKGSIDRKLVVHKVGDFIASFVPTQGDFGRLDEQFRIPQKSWDQIPKYADYGFAVFQLANRSGKPHPMAFKFHSRLNTGDASAQIFFPTVHIHDGEVHRHEHFDHTLFLQSPSFDEAAGDYRERPKLVADDATGYVRSKWNAEEFCDINAAKGILDPQSLVHLKKMKGDLENDDVLAGGIELERSKSISQWKKSSKTTIAVSTGLVSVAGMAWFFNRRNKVKEQDS